MVRGPGIKPGSVSDVSTSFRFLLDCFFETVSRPANKHYFQGCQIILEIADMINILV